VVRYEYKCPSCGDHSRIDIAANVWVRLRYNRDGSIAGADEWRESHQWTRTSEAHCAQCGHRGVLSTFENNKRKKEEPG